MPSLFWPGLLGPFGSVVDWLSRRHDSVGYGASLLKVFLPYLVWNTVFDNTRVIAEMGRAPAPFASYCFPLLKFARENRFRYPYRDWPGSPAETHSAEPPAHTPLGSLAQSDRAQHIAAGGSQR
jgi:hypothetical protein